jgi:hypothetical protein
MLKNKCCLYVIISIRFFSIMICNLLIELPSYIGGVTGLYYRDTYFMFIVLRCFYTLRAFVVFVTTYNAKNIHPSSLYRV